MEAEVDKLIERFMRELTVEDLKRSFHYTLGKGKKRKVVTRDLKSMLWHLIEEELQHRGELNALLWQDDIEPPVTSWYSWEKSIEGKRQKRSTTRSAINRT